MALMHFLNQGNRLSPRKVAAIIHTSPEEVAVAVGLKESAQQPGTEAMSDETQRRLSELAQLFEVLKPRFRSRRAACVWYRSKQLPGFGGRTARQLVQQGKTQHVLDYLDAIDAGIHA